MIRRLEGKVLAGISPSPGLLSGRADLRRGPLPDTQEEVVRGTDMLSVLSFTICKRSHMIEWA